MTKHMDEFIKAAKVKGMDAKALPLAKSMYGLIADARNATVDECMDLLTSWATIAQFDQRPDFKLLVETMAKMKDDLSE